MKVSRDPTSARALGVLVRRRDHTSPEIPVVECLLTRAEEFLGLGRRNNIRPGMVWLLAIRVPIAFRHTELRSVSSAAGDAVPSPRLVSWKTTDTGRFFHHAM
jgi:hypothetical protein